MSNELHFVGKPGNKSSLILFVHGFTGNQDTWTHPNGNDFPTMLSRNETISKHFDIACFRYYTKLLDLFAIGDTVFKKIKAIFSDSLAKSQKNVCIEEISNYLQSVIRFKLSNYDNIIVIAHSMGGLVTKDVIVKDFKKHSASKIKLFLSLAVPHQGSKLATFGGLVSKNLQIGGLDPLNRFITDLNQDWIDLKTKPLTKYFYGHNDSIVIPKSAVSMESPDAERDVVPLDDDHTSISKPANEESLVFCAVTSFITDIQPQLSLIDASEYQSLEDKNSYDDELFVLKLMVADVHSSTIHDAKELFLNAEYARKLLKSRSDQKNLEELYVKIRRLYKDSYNKFLHGKPANSGLLVAELHEKITTQDEALLKSMIPLLKAFHKQGMLHQLSNNLEMDIWWTADKSLTPQKEDGND